MIDSISANFITGATVALATTRPVSGEEEEQSSLRVDNQRDDRQEDRDLRVEQEDKKNDGPTGRNVDTYA